MYELLGVGVDQVMADVSTSSLLYQNCGVHYGSLFQVADHALPPEWQRERPTTFHNGVWLLGMHVASIT